jgi:uncharacterized protein (UPF0179 family)
MQDNLFTTRVKNVNNGSGLEEPRKVVTLIPTEVAKQGYEFVFVGDACAPCETCRVKNSCLGNMDRGHRYVVKQVKTTEHYCALVDAGAKVVEVEKTDIKVTVEKQKFMLGATVNYLPIQCDWKFCQNYAYCVENGLNEDEKVKILEKLGEVNCPRGFKLFYTKVKH